MQGQGQENYLLLNEGTHSVKTGLSKMLKGGVIMDVVCNVL